MTHARHSALPGQRAPPTWSNRGDAWSNWPSTAPGRPRRQTAAALLWPGPSGRTKSEPGPHPGPKIAVRQIGGSTENQLNKKIAAPDALARSLRVLPENLRPRGHEHAFLYFNNKAPSGTARPIEFRRSATRHVWGTSCTRERFRRIRRILKNRPCFTRKSGQKIGAWPGILYSRLPRSAVARRIDESLSSSPRPDGAPQLARLASIPDRATPRPLRPPPRAAAGPNTPDLGGDVS